jgi:hypothetical protein
MGDVGGCTVKITFNCFLFFAEYKLGHSTREKKEEELANAQRNGSQMKRNSGYALTKLKRAVSNILIYAIPLNNLTRCRENLNLIRPDPSFY